MHKPIPVNTPLLSGNELKYLTECIETGWISSEGPFISEFEKKFSTYVQRKYGIAVSVQILAACGLMRSCRWLCQ